ncbi:MAG TPA: asparagine synthase C-terminal domain-containing protein, partial [Opitutaceae bacterium]|nr:asparagine synthase C-terminal domain-containing protein [Opitutaceae bacterium]
TWHQDEPFTTTSIFAQWCVFRQARKSGVIVMLDGQGADEALGGYHSYFGPWLAGLLARGRWGELFREGRALRREHGLAWAAQAALVADEVLPSAVSNALRSLGGRTVARPEFLDLARLGAEPRWPHARRASWREPVRSFGLAQIQSLSVPQLVHWEDRNSMAQGVEARLPFLDYRLVEFCLGLPEEFKLAGGWTKRVLRESMRGILPESVRLRRDKLGFATAEEDWMRHTRRAEFTRLAQRSLEPARGLVTAAAWRKIERILSGQERFNFQLWRLISFGAWLERFAVDTRAP